MSGHQNQKEKETRKKQCQADRRLILLGCIGVKHVW
uniref:Uncharacterized protein n=1 Tax=Arundo donax TaxID=35708 RepID=A0A0A9ETL6_ARUDO